MVYVEHLLSFGEAGILADARQRACLHDQLPVRTLGAESLRASLVGSISHVLSQLVSGVIKCILCDSREKTLGSWSLVYAGLHRGCFLHLLIVLCFLLH